jgi:hypothetical protein
MIGRAEYGDDTMRKLIPLLMFAAAIAAPATAQAARATECTALNICYCVEQDLKGAIDTNVSKIRQAIAEQKSYGKAIGYMSLPISTVGGGYFGVNIDVAEKTKTNVEKRFGAKSLWILNPGEKSFALPGGANGADYMLMWTRVLEGPSGTGDDFDLFYFVGSSDFAAALGLTGEGDMEKIEALFEQRYAADEGLRKAVEQGRLTKAAFRNYYTLRASIAFSYGSHDEWNILRLINDKRRGGTQFGVANQVASFYDGRPTPPSAAEQAVSSGYVGRCNF